MLGVAHQLLYSVGGECHMLGVVHELLLVVCQIADIEGGGVNEAACRRLWGPYSPESSDVKERFVGRETSRTVLARGGARTRQTSESPQRNENTRDTSDLFRRKKLRGYTTTSTERHEVL